MEKTNKQRLLDAIGWLYEKSEKIVALKLNAADTFMFAYLLWRMQEAGLSLSAGKKPSMR